jgi:hypothetical protein
MKLQFPTAAVLTLLTISWSAEAQPETAMTSHSNGSKSPILTSDQLFRKSIWRAVDLREKQNKPMFSEGKEISRFIIEAVKRGELQAYKNDSLTSRYTIKQVSANMSFAEGGDERSQAEIDAGIPSDNSDDFWPIAPASGGAAGGRKPKLGANGLPLRDRRGRIIYETAAVVPAKPKSFEYRYKDLFQMELKEDLVFDKKRSRMYHDIQTVTLLVPSTAPNNAAGYEKPVATFKYSDLVRVFRNHPESAIWFNAQNDAQHKNLADAFELGLFNSYITKVSNPNDSSLSDAYGSARDGILAAQQTSADLVEYEYNLWSY